MPPSNPFPDGHHEAGSAPVEFLTLGVLLLVPIVYLVLVLGVLQGASFAAEGAARHAARMLVDAPTDAEGRREATTAVQVALSDWRIPASAATVAIACVPVPDDCLAARGTVRVTVRVAAALPLLPPALAVGAPGTIPVEAQAVQRASMFEPR